MEVIKKNNGKFKKYQLVDRTEEASSIQMQHQSPVETTLNLLPKGSTSSKLMLSGPILYLGEPVMIGQDKTHAI